MDVFDVALTESAFVDGMDRLATELGAGPTADGGRTVVLLTAPKRSEDGSLDPFVVERIREAARQVTVRRNGAVQEVSMERLWCGPVRCIDQARLYPAKGRFEVVSPNAEAFGTARSPAWPAGRSPTTWPVMHQATSSVRFWWATPVAWSIGSTPWHHQSSGSEDSVVESGRVRLLPGPPRVLMYHMVRAHIDGAKFNKLRVEPKEFEKQVAWMKAEGFHFVTMQELQKNWGKHPEKTVAITFDDGYLDNLENAYPILEKYQAKATIYVVVDRHDRDWSTYKKAHHNNGELAREAKLNDKASSIFSK